MITRDGENAEISSNTYIKNSGFQIGPIPIDDGIGKEVVTQITTEIKSNKTFYTDSNGRDFLERVRHVVTSLLLTYTDTAILYYYYYYFLIVHMRV